METPHNDALVVQIPDPDVISRLILDMSVDGTLTKAWRSLRCNLWCSGGTENQDAEDEYHRTAQASWVQRMFTSLFSDSALFNTREGRAGKVDGHDHIMMP